ncbi:MAG: hypothetical protein SF053_08780 [Bacteroidia bacterium]|nr:hypothetical protein [Bacteroidia bacterium]
MRHFELHPTMVGAADNINLGFMSLETEQFMIAANEFLLRENLQNFGDFLVSDKPIKWGDKSFDGLCGSDLDNQMVVIEQTILENFITKYKSEFISKNGEEAWEKIEHEINGLFGNEKLSFLTPKSNQYAQKEFKRVYGKDAKFDFMDIEHRTFQGQKMAEYVRNNEE